MEKKYLFAFLYMFCVFLVFGQEYNLHNGITLSRRNKRAGIEVTFNEEAPMISPWDRGRVTRFSNNANNAANLGRFVEIEYDMGFDFEGISISQGKILVIFSNLLEINVTEETIISKGTLIGKTQRGFGNRLKVFLLSETEDVGFLQMWTNNRKRRIDNLWYWDPAFLFR